MAPTIPTCSTALVIGAGFSVCAGLPVQDEFSSLLLADEFSASLDKAITRALQNFLSDVFGWRAASTFPSLEDIFTCIDLSAGSGHNLGIKYTPKMLRAIRRMAIYRIFSVLDRHFVHSPDIEALLVACTSALSGPTGFIVLNWDIVLEKHLAKLHPSVQPNYACEAFDWNQPSLQALGDRTAPVCKMHGSSNWVYCENCKSLFYDLNEKLSLRTKVGLIKADFRLFDESFANAVFDSSLGIEPGIRECHHCKFMVSSHIATFSYRKSFRTHAYPSVWYAAEQILSDAEHWIFIGYSLPKADYELKHLLKVAQLRLTHMRHGRKLKIDVVVKGDLARRDYEAFFGENSFSYYSGGLESYVSTTPGVDNVRAAKSI